MRDSRNFVLCPGDAYDRSPCGTGTSAKLACLYTDGKLCEGETWRQESITGSVFEGSIEREGDLLIPDDHRRGVGECRGDAYPRCFRSSLLGHNLPTVEMKSIFVLGAGVIGLFSAYYAMRRGHKVSIVERAVSAYEGCSSGNAGMIVPSHFVPLAAPGMAALGLRIMADPEGPFSHPGHPWIFGFWTGAGS